MDRDCVISDFQPGTRVEVHPCTDWWMMGARFGTVTKVDRDAGTLRVKLDRMPKTIVIAPSLIDPGTFNPNRFLG